MSKKLEVQTNGNGVFKHFGEIKKVTKVQNFWREFEFNERTFSLLLFAFSFLIVLGKLAVNFGYPSYWPLVDRKIKLNTLTSYQLSELDTRSLETYAESVNRFLDNYGWIFKATVSGLATMGFTWFIIYKDSNFPGVNPPSPFRNSKKQFAKQTEISTNYLVGALNGMLIFFYMCL